MTVRITDWNPNKMDATFENVALDRLIKAAEVIKNKVKSKTPVGTTSRPIYRKGPYAGQPWTARDAGQLKKSVRVVRKKTKSGKALSRKRNIRVYVGNYLAYYANIVEFYTPFMSIGFESALGEVKEIIGAK